MYQGYLPLLVKLSISNRKVNMNLVIASCCPILVQSYIEIDLVKKGRYNTAS